MIKDILIKIIPFTGVVDSTAHGVYAMFIWLLSIIITAVITFAIGLILFAVFNNVLVAITGDKKVATKFWRNVTHSIFS